MIVCERKWCQFYSSSPVLSRGKRKLNWPAATVRCDRALFSFSPAVYSTLFFFLSRFYLSEGLCVCVCWDRGNAFFVVRKAGMLRLDDAKVKWGSRIDSILLREEGFLLARTEIREETRNKGLKTTRTTKPLPPKMLPCVKAQHLGLLRSTLLLLLFCQHVSYGEDYNFLASFLPTLTRHR